MGIFSHIKRSIKKTKDISEIPKILGDTKIPNVKDFLSGDLSKRDDAKEKLYDLC